MLGIAPARSQADRRARGPRAVAALVRRRRSPSGRAGHLSTHCRGRN